MRVLVTGGNGLIGVHAVAELLSRGIEVHVLGRRQFIGLSSQPGVTSHHADIFDRDAISELMRKIRPTHLLHFAWITTHGIYWRAPENLDWLAATAHLIRCFAESGGKRIVTAGTCAEYDWSAEELVTGDCLENSTPIRPHTFYGAIKDSCRRMIDAYSAECGIQSAWGRVFFLFGALEDKRRLVPSIVFSLKAGNPAACTSGTQIRDFLAVEDIGAAFGALTISDVCGVVNIGSGEPLRVSEIALAIGEAMGRPDLVHLGALPSRMDDPPRLVADVHRLRHDVGFTPAMQFKDRLKSCISSMLLP